jgi:hypothetical protein
MKIKVGDFILCHTPCVMDSGQIVTTAGKYYIVTKIDTDKFGAFCIIDDDGYEHHFGIQQIKHYDYIYNYWFYSPTISLRKDKLKKLENESSKW